VVAGGPAAATLPGGPVTIYIQSRNGTAYQRSYTNVWSPWTPLGGTLTTSPAAASPGAAAAWVVGGGTDGRLYQDLYRSGTWSGWQLLPFG